MTDTMLLRPDSPQAGAASADAPAAPRIRRIDCGAGANATPAPRPRCARGGRRPLLRRALGEHAD